MGFSLPSSLTPSKVSTFKDCALAFRFSVVERIPEPPSLPASKGTLVHAALQRLYELPPDRRTPESARECLEAAWAELRHDDEFRGLRLDAAQERGLLEEASSLTMAIFRLEDPTEVRPIGLELVLETSLDGDDGPLLRGIIDRLELDEDGALVVTDYKTGRAPTRAYERRRLGGVRFYALMCERVLGRRPVKIQLHYLAEPTTIALAPTDQGVKGIERELTALWSAIRRACATEHFKERTSKLCEWCNFKPWCPAWGGDPTKAAEEAPEVLFGR